MSEITERVRAQLEAFSRTGELGAGFLADDFELHQASSIVDTAGVFHGRSGVRDSLRELEEAFEDLSFQAERTVEAPNGSVVLFIHVRGRGRGSGMEIDNHIAWVMTFRGDQMVRLVVHEDPATAIEAAGLEG